MLPALLHVNMILEPEASKFLQRHHRCSSRPVCNLDPSLLSFRTDGLTAGLCDFTLPLW